jgi:hypothetical protein
MTGRNITASVNNALQASNVIGLMFIELNFASGVQRLNNSGYDIAWNGYTWIGAGAVGKIDTIEEGAETQMSGISMTLSGVPSSQISVALGENYQGRTAKLWFATLNNDYSIIADPVGPFGYRMDTMNIDLGETATITLTAESKLSDWDRPRISRYNHEDQQLKSAGDKFCEYTAQMVNVNLKWGKA